MIECKLNSFRILDVTIPVGYVSVIAPTSYGRQVANLIYRSLRLDDPTYFLDSPNVTGRVLSIDEFEEASHSIMGVAEMLCISRESRCLLYLDVSDDFCVAILEQRLADELPEIGFAELYVAASQEFETIRKSSPNGADTEKFKRLLERAYRGKSLEAKGR